MIKENTEIAIIGAGFSGSLLALILNRLGRKTILIEKAKHPRFAIGESSTPLANLCFENICKTYDLNALTPLTKYGSWQKKYPEIPCGLKRGFSFFKHSIDQPFRPRHDHSNELLVAANPTDELGDTHWFRETFDHFLVNEVKSQGIPYYDQTTIEDFKNGSSSTLTGQRLQHAIEIKAEFVVIAAGDSFEIQESHGLHSQQTPLRTNSWSIYNHFRDVAAWDEILSELGADTSVYPFACDDAALHHIFDDGWMWVLRFNNGVTSAGFAFNAYKKQYDESRPENIWANAIKRLPSVAQQFSKATTVQDFTITRRLQRRLPKAAGKGWVRLPHSIYFIDPLLSTGNAHTLLGIERLATILAEHWGKKSFDSELAKYEVRMQREINFLDQLIHGCYNCFNNFELFSLYSMYYFAGATYSEHKRKNHLNFEDDEFLYSNHQPFKERVSSSYKKVLDSTNSSSFINLTKFRNQVQQDIDPYNIAELCLPEKQNMYPYI